MFVETLENPRCTKNQSIHHHCLTIREEGVVGLELAGYDFNIEVCTHQIGQLNEI